MQQFNNMNELVEYLGNLENRVKSLETENVDLRALAPKDEGMDGNMIAKYVSNALPQTNLLSPGFFKRAFAVWGHFFVANLIIGIIFTIVYFCFVMVLLGPVFGSLIQQGR